MYRRRLKRRGGFCLPGYLYCGPGCSGPGKPVNVLDAICQEHDLCYQVSRNRFLCDQKMLAQLRPLLKLRTREGRDARLVYSFINMKIRL
ncbi:hypothetical protein RZN25_03975 [Bacillaceae bacterium S4-13-56]